MRSMASSTSAIDSVRTFPTSMLIAAASSSLRSPMSCSVARRTARRSPYGTRRHSRCAACPASTASATTSAPSYARLARCRRREGSSRSNPSPTARSRPPPRCSSGSGSRSRASASAASNARSSSALRDPVVYVSRVAIAGIASHAMALRSLFVAALQTAGVPGDPQATLAQFERNVHALRETFEGLELVVAPELHLMALPPLLEENGASPLDLAIDIPGDLTEQLGALARETGLWLVPGSVYERTGGGAANTAGVLSPAGGPPAAGAPNTAVGLSPAGELVASYRKCFPWQPYETTQPGTRTVCFDIDGVGRFGLAICHDGAFPEVFRSLAWHGAEAIFQVTLTDTSDRDMETVVVRANAYMNQVA